MYRRCEVIEEIDILVGDESIDLDEYYSETIPINFIQVNGNVFYRKLVETSSSKEHLVGIDYKNSIPRKDRIDIINNLYNEGNIITYWTGRGTVSGIDWTFLTKNQLNEWGAKYHNLLLGKPSYDIFIDDKSFNSENYFSKK